MEGIHPLTKDVHHSPFHDPVRTAGPPAPGPPPGKSAPRASGAQGMSRPATAQPGPPAPVQVTGDLLGLAFVRICTSSSTVRHAASNVAGRSRVSIEARPSVLRAPPPHLLPGSRFTAAPMNMSPATPGGRHRQCQAARFMHASRPSRLLRRRIGLGHHCPGGGPQQVRPVGRTSPPGSHAERFAEALAAVRNPGRCTRHHYVAVAAAAPTPALEVGPRCAPPPGGSRPRSQGGYQGAGVCRPAWNRPRSSTCSLAPCSTRQAR